MTTPDVQSDGKKRRRTWLTALKWAAFSIACLVLIVVVVFFEAIHSPRLHKYLLATANRQASAALGVPVEIENYALHLSNLSVDVYGITIHGAAPYPDPPLLQVRHVAAGVRVVSLLGGKWHLRNVRIDAPVIHIILDVHGKSNLPSFAHDSGSESKSFNLFDFGIRHVVLDRGEIYYNDKKIPIAADLHDLKLRARYAVLDKSYAGSVSYRDAHLQAGSLIAIPHDLDAQFKATATEFHLIRADLGSGSAQVLLTATLENYRHPSIHGNYQAKLNGSDIRRILHNPSIPTGWIETRGTAAYRELASRTFLQRLDVNGTLDSRQLDLNADGTPFQLNTLRASYSLTDGNLKVPNFRGELLGGKLQASLKVNDLDGDSHGELMANARQVSLASLKRLAPATTAGHNLSLSGIVDADTKAHWGKSLMESLVATLNVTVHGLASGRMPNRNAVQASDADASQATMSTAVPVAAEIHAAYSAAGKKLALSHSYLRLPQTTLTVNGILDGQSQLALDFQSKDLGEVEDIADIFRTSRQGEVPAQLGLGGSASFKASVIGSTAAPHLSGEFIASNLRVKGTAWRTLRTGIDLRPSSASLNHAELIPVSGGSIAFSAGVDLHKWKFQNTNAVHADLRASGVSVEDIVKAPGAQLPVTGLLAAELHLRGSESNPTGQGNLSITHGQVYGEPLQLVQVNLSATEGQVHVNAAASLPAGTIEAVASFQPKEKTYIAQIASSGLDLSQLQAIQARNLDIQGHLRLTAQGQGTLQDPQFTASVEIPRLQMQDQAITAVAIKMDLAHRVANATLSAQDGSAPIQAKANLQMVGEYPIHASLDTQSISLEPFLAMYIPSEAGKLNGETEVHAVVDGPLKQKGLIEAHVTLPVLKVGYGNQVQVAAQSPVHIDYKDWVLGIQRTTIQGSDIDLQVQGSIPMRGHGIPSLLLDGTVNLKIAQLLNPDIKSSGEVRLNVNGFGDGNSGMAGKIELTKANLTNGEWPIGLHNGNAVLTLTKDRLNITSLSGEVGGGKLTGQGSITYRPHTVFDVGVAAKGIRMLYPEGVREELDADLRLTGTADNALLGGRVNLNDLSFTPSFDLAGFISQFGGVSAPAPQGFAQNVNLRLAVTTPNSLNMVSRTMSFGGTANLEVRGTAARPVILGRVNVSNGDIIFNGDRYLLNGGTIEFVNPSETQPVVNLALNTTIQQYNINLRFRGPVDHLHTNYSSDPALPEADIINLLAFGQTTEASASNATVPGKQAAMSAVASQVSSQITSRVSKIAGISQLSINPVLRGGSSQGPAGANITIRQRVTGNLFVTFSSNVTSTQNQIIMGQYQLSPRFAISGTRDQNGGFAIDVTRKKTW